MAYNLQYLWYLVNPIDGSYYAATQQPNGSWDVTSVSSSDPYGDGLYIKMLPKDWSKLQLSWKRNRTYMGTFRSDTNTYEFVGDGAAILRSLYVATGSGGIEASCVLRIDMLQETESSPGANDFWRYETVYQSDINFALGDYDHVAQTFKLPTKDSKLFTLLEANASTQYNIPFWFLESGAYITDAWFAWMGGLKLQYNARFISGATPDHPVTSQNTSGSGGLTPYTQDALSFSQNIPYIGNELLKNQLLAGNMSQKTEQTGFDNYTTNDYGIKPITTSPGAGTHMWAHINAIPTQIIYNNPPATKTLTIQWFIVALDSSNAPDLGSLNEVARLEITNNAGVADFGEITLADPAIDWHGDDFYAKNDTVYTLLWKYQYVGLITTPPANNVKITYSKYELEIYNLEDGILNVNATTAIGYRPHQLLDKIVKCLNSTTTTPNGFPIIPVDTPYSGVSAYLEDETQTYANNYDTIPYRTLWTSGNALRLLAGQTYVTVSMSDFFKTAFGVWGCGLGIEGNNIRVEPLKYFFDKDTQLFDLGENIANFSDQPFTEYAANNLRGGYKTQYQDFSQYVGTETSYYGLDVFNIQQDYRLPITRYKSDLDWTAPVVSDVYKIELARASSNNNGGSASSSSNDNYLIEVTADVVALPDYIRPNGSPVGVSAYGCHTYAGIQSTTPSSPPYARGVTYPDTMYNYGLSPARCLLRKGGFLNSICGTLQDRTVAFQKQYWQLYNGNTSIDVSGIAANLDCGLIEEVKDISVADLPPKLFMPYVYKFDTEQPLNMYAIVNSNPYGYIQFTEVNAYGVKTVRRGFVINVQQILGSRLTTTFELMAHPDDTLS